MSMVVNSRLHLHARYNSVFSPKGLVMSFILCLDEPAKLKVLYNCSLQGSQETKKVDLGSS